jgi:hypothetical protein
MLAAIVARLDLSKLSFELQCLGPDNQSPALCTSGELESSNDVGQPFARWPITAVALQVSALDYPIAAILPYLETHLRRPKSTSAVTTLPLAVM